MSKDIEMISSSSRTSAIGGTSARDWKGIIATVNGMSSNDVDM